MYTKPTAPRSIGGVLDGAFSLWLPVLRKTWLLILIPHLVSFVLALPQLSKMTTMRPGQFPSLSGSWINQILSLVVSLLYLGFYNAMIARADDAASHGSMTLGQSLEVGFKYWLRTFLQMLILIAVMLPLIVALLPVIISAGRAQAGQLPDLTMLGGLSLVVLAYVPLMLFLFGRVFLATPVLVLEDRSAWSSIRGSWNLTRSNWWRCAAILTVLTIVTYIVFMIAGLVLAVIGYRNGIQAGLLSFKALVATQILGLAVGVLFTPLFLGGILSMYYDLKLRKEGGDLAGRVESLSSAKT